MTESMPGRALLDSPLNPSPLNDQRTLPLMKVDECAHDFIEWYYETWLPRTGQLTRFGWCPCCWLGGWLLVGKPPANQHREETHA